MTPPPALMLFLDRDVPRWIDVLAGTTPGERAARARRCADVLAADGDLLVARDMEPFGAAAHAFDALAEGLAIEAYQPGGVTFPGRHWEAGA